MWRCGRPVRSRPWQLPPIARYIPTPPTTLALSKHGVHMQSISCNRIVLLSSAVLLNMSRSSSMLLPVLSSTQQSCEEGRLLPVLGEAQNSVAAGRHGPFLALPHLVEASRSVTCKNESPLCGSPHSQVFQKLQVALSLTTESTCQYTSEGEKQQHPLPRA